MDEIRGGLLSSVATAALGIGFAGFNAPGICSIDGGGEGGGGGGAADLLDDDAGGGSGSGSGSGSVDGGSGSGSGSGSGDGGAGGGDGGSGGGGDLNFDWAVGVSAEAGDGKDTSNLDWLKGTKVKDLDTLVTIARDNQKALRESGRIKIPGADAKPEEVKAYREALGVPDKPEGYEIKLPEGIDGEKYAIDEHFLGPLRQVALDNHIPGAAFSAFADAFIKQQAEDMQAEAARNDQALQDHLKSWGASAAAKREEFKRGTQILGLDRAAVQKIQAGFGVGPTLDLLAKIGSLAGEDFFAGGQAAEKFGVADLESAQKQIDAMINDPATAKKLRDKSDKALVEKYNRLSDAVARFKELEKEK